MLMCILNWLLAFLLSLIILYAPSSNDEMEKAMTGMWNLVAQISTHKAYYKQTHAAVCVCECVLGGCVFNRLEGWFKNRMFSHSSVSKTHLFSTYWHAVSSFLLSLASMIPCKFITNWFGLKTKKKKFWQIGKEPWLFTFPYSLSLFLSSL